MSEIPTKSVLKQVFVTKTQDSLIQFIRYGLVSGAALVVDFGGMILLKEVFHVNYLIAATISFVLGLIVNYLLSLVWVFERSQYSRKKEFTIFAAIGICGLGLNDVVIWLLTGKLGVFYVLSKLVATLLTFLWNFSARKYLLFK